MRHSGRRPRGGTTRRRRRGTTTRAVVVDDYEPLRRLLKEALQERGCEVVAEAANTEKHSTRCAWAPTSSSWTSRRRSWTAWPARRPSMTGPRRQDRRVHVERRP